MLVESNCVWRIHGLHYVIKAGTIKMLKLFVDNLDFHHMVCFDVF